MPTPRRARRGAALLSLLLAPALTGVVGSGAPAHAAPVEDSSTVVVDSGRGDVVRVDVRDESTRPAPERRVGDLVRTRYTLDESGLRVSWRFAELRRNKTMNVFVLLHDAQGAFVAAGVTLRPDNPAGRLRVDISTDDMGDSEGRRCRGADHQVDVRAGRIVVTMPASCLPEVDRWTAVSRTVVADKTKKGLVAYYDRHRPTKLPLP